ncbi:MAG TPA: hypothetical protein VFZ37_07290 [Jiangellaceae bacterium]
MTQFIVSVVVLVVAVAAIIGSYRAIRDDGGPRRSPLPAEPSIGNTILPHPCSRRPHDRSAVDVVAERRRALERRRAQYAGGRVNV